MKFKNKKELIDFIKAQLNIELINDKTDILNNKRNLLHVEIEDKNKLSVLSLLQKYNIMYENHIKNSYFIFVK